MVFMACEAVRISLGPLQASRVFEFGCGTGRNLQVLKELGANQVSGCDLSKGMLEVARDRGLDVCQHDMNDPLPLEVESVDLVLFCLTLEHIANLGPPLYEARRILKPSGRIAIFEIHPYMSHGGVAAHFQDGAQEVHMPTYPHRFADYLNAFAKAHLSVTECREWRPRDIGVPPPLKALKRGPDFPLLVEFALTS